MAQKKKSTKKAVKKTPKKATTKKTAVKRAPARKTATKKAVVKKATAKKAVAKKAAVKKRIAKKAVTKKAATKKAVAKKATTKKAVAKKAAVKKKTAKKVAVKKVAVKKATSKKAATVKAKRKSAAKPKAKTPVKATSTTTRKKTAKKAAPASKVEKKNKTTEDKAVTTEKPVSSRRPSGASLKFLVSVAQAVKNAVAPLAKAVKGREIVDEAPSGDVTFLLDRVAEKALFTHLKSAALPIAYYSEHEGYSTFSSKSPKSLLIVDPIDGTRAAKNGFEGCVVAVASTRVIERPTIADVDCACVMDLLGERIFLAERGKGARVYVDGRLKRPKLSDNVDLESMIWSMTIPARPAELIFPTAARIIDLSSLKGGFFACNSTSFSLTRLVTNQLDACVDIANRYYRDMPDRVEDYFINAGRGKVIGVAPYDIAASLLIAQEAGCVVTDAYGKNFDDLLLLDSSKSNHQSIIAASNPELHEKLLGFFDMRIRQYEQLLTRHTGGE